MELDANFLILVALTSGSNMHCTTHKILATTNEYRMRIHKAGWPNKITNWLCKANICHLFLLSTIIWPSSTPSLFCFALFASLPIKEIDSIGLNKWIIHIVFVKIVFLDRFQIDFECLLALHPLYVSALAFIIVIIIIRCSASAYHMVWIQFKSIRIRTH